MKLKIIHISEWPSNRPQMGFNYINDTNNISHIHICSLHHIKKEYINDYKKYIQFITKSNDTIFKSDKKCSLKYAIQLIVNDKSVKCIILDNYLTDQEQKLIKKIKDQVKIYYIGHGILDKFYGNEVKKNNKFSIGYFDNLMVPWNNHIYYQRPELKKRLVLLNSLPQLDWGCKINRDIQTRMEYKDYIFNNFVGIKTEIRTIFLINDFKRCKLNNKVLVEFNEILSNTIAFAVKNNYIILLKMRFKGYDVKQHDDLKNLYNLMKNPCVVNCPEYIYTYHLFFADIIVVHNNGTSYIEAIASNWKTILVQFYDFHDNLNTNQYDLIKCMNKTQYTDILAEMDSDPTVSTEYLGKITNYLNYWFKEYRNTSVNDICNFIKNNNA